MCTKVDAIRIVVTQKSGMKSMLIDRIGRHYDSFVTLGLIAEFVPVPEALKQQGYKGNADWVATDLAKEKAKFYNLELGE